MISNVNGAGYKHFQELSLPSDNRNDEDNRNKSINAAAQFIEEEALGYLNDAAMDHFVCSLQNNQDVCVVEVDPTKAIVMLGLSVVAHVVKEKTKQPEWEQIEAIDPTPPSIDDQPKSDANNKGWWFW